MKTIRKPSPVEFALRSLLASVGRRQLALTIDLILIQLIPGFSETDDDLRLLATGEMIRSRLELWFDASGIPDWYVTTKSPMRSRRGRFVGVMGISTHYQQVPRYSASGNGLPQVVE